MKDLRSLVVKLVIGSFSIAALLGIVALLGAGFGETEAQVLLTTVIVGIESVAVLCYLAVAGRRSVWVGVLGGVISLVPFGIALWLTWVDSDTGVHGATWDVFGIGLTVAGSIAEVCLLLALVDRTRHRTLLIATLAAIAVVATMITVAIVDGSWLDDLYWRLFGIVAILDVLGTVVLAALGTFGRRSITADPEPLLTPRLEARIAAVARQRGTSPQQVLEEALDRLEQSS